MVLAEILVNIKNPTAILTRNEDQYRALSTRTRHFFRRAKEKYVSSLAEDIEGHLNANGLKAGHFVKCYLKSRWHC